MDLLWQKAEIQNKQSLEQMPSGLVCTVPIWRILAQYPYAPCGSSIWQSSTTTLFSYCPKPVSFISLSERKQIITVFESKAICGCCNKGSCWLGSSVTPLLPQGRNKLPVLLMQMYGRASDVLDFPGSISVSDFAVWHRQQCCSIQESWKTSSDPQGSTPGQTHSKLSLSLSFFLKEVLCQLWLL